MERNAGIIKELTARAEKLSAKAAKHEALRVKYDEAAAGVQKAIEALKAQE